MKSEIVKQLNLPNVQNDGWWISWCYLPTGYHDYRADYDLIPNFKEMNEAAVLLADEDKRKQFVSDSIEIIEKKLLSLIRKK